MDYTWLVDWQNYLLVQQVYYQQPSLAYRLESFYRVASLDDNQMTFLDELDTYNFEEHTVMEMMELIEVQVVALMVAFEQVDT